MILNNYIFQNLTWPPIDENTNYIKELNNVKTVRPISTKIGRKYSVATIYTLGCLKCEFHNEKLKNLIKYVNTFQVQ